MWRSQQEGGESVLGGVRDDPGERGKGFSSEPTILSDVEPGMRVEKEEIFGPCCRL